MAMRRWDGDGWESEAHGLLLVLACSFPPPPFLGMRDDFWACKQNCVFGITGCLDLDRLVQSGTSVLWT